MKKLYISMLTLLISSSSYAQTIDYVSHAGIMTFIFFTGLIFALIPGALLKGFNLSLKYNVLLGFIFSGVIFYIAFDTSKSQSYSILLSLTLFIGWGLSNIFLHKLILETSKPKSNLNP